MKVKNETFVSVKKMKHLIKRIDLTLKNHRLIAGFIGSLGFFFVIAAVQSFVTTQSFVKESKKTTGTVIRNLTHEDDTYSPVIHFITSDNQQIEYTETSSQRPARFFPGEKVIILYKEADPYNAKIGTKDFLYESSLLFGLMGGGSLFLAFFILILFKYCGKPYIEGIPAAIIVCIVFIIFGILLIFMGSPLWSSSSSLIIGGILIMLFGMAVLVWEIVKTNLEKKLLRR